MQSVIIQMVIMLHAAFGCMFLFLNRQHPARFSRLMAQSWFLEAFRACINLTQLHDLGGLTSPRALPNGAASIFAVRKPPRGFHEDSQQPQVAQGSPPR